MTEIILFIVRMVNPFGNCGGFFIKTHIMNKFTLNGNDVLIKPAKTHPDDQNIFEYYHRQGNNFYFRSELVQVKISGIDWLVGKLKKGEKFHIVF